MSGQLADLRYQIDIKMADGGTGAEDMRQHNSWETEDEKKGLFFQLSVDWDSIVYV